MFGHFEQVENTQKTRCARQFRRDIRETDRLDRVHFNLAFVHPVTAAHFDVRLRPDAHGARNLSAPDSLTKAFRKKHAETERY